MKENQLVKIIAADPSPTLGQFYKNGDTMRIARVWAGKGGVDAIDDQGNSQELFNREFEVIDEKADAVNSPNHYNTGRFETIELIEAVTSGYKEGFQSYCIGNTLKYISRAPFKHETPLEDLRKAAKYLEFAIAAIEEGKAS